MRNLLLLSCSLCAFTAVFSQGLSSHQADSLKTILANQSGEASIHTLLALADYQIFKAGERKEDLDSARQYLALAGLINQQTHSVRAQAGIAFFQSRLSREEGHPDLARQQLQQSMPLIRRAASPDLLGKAYSELSSYFSYETESEVTARMNYLDTAVQYLHQAGDLRLEGDNLKMLADLQLLHRDYTKGYKNLSASLAAYKSAGFKEIQGVYDLLAEYYMVQGFNKEALQNALLAQKTCQEQGDSSMQLCEIDNRTGVILHRLGDAKTAAAYFTAALGIAKIYHDKNSTLTVVANLVAAYHSAKQPRLAENVLKWAAGVYDSEHDFIPSFLLNKAFVSVYQDLMEYDKGQPHAIRLMHLLDSLQYKDNSWIIARNVLIRFFIASNQLATAERLLRDNEKDVAQSHDSIGLAQTHLNWFSIDSARKDYPAAIGHLLARDRINDAWLNSTRTRQFEELRVKYETEQRESEVKARDGQIAILRQKDALSQTNLHQATLIRNITGGGLLVIALVATLLYRQYKINRRSGLVISQKNSELQQLIIEKEWLLKEVHHRVKNNLQIIASLLNTQSSYLENPVVLGALRDSQSRVQAMSLIHQKVYGSDHLSGVDMQSYIPDLLSYLYDCFDAEKRRIRFDQRIETIRLDLAQAVPIGLILNEAVTNAIKYAFTGSGNSNPGSGDTNSGIGSTASSTGGTIRVSFRQLENQRAELIISDNGRGIPGGFDISTATSMGMKMMTALSRQLRARLTVTHCDGVTITLEFSLIRELPNLRATG
ncbi:MAG TPA: sensor histidine kinase [Puia sp.]|jgi:two-component sensor histidine kinase